MFWTLSLVQFLFESFFLVLVSLMRILQGYGRRAAWVFPTSSRQLPFRLLQEENLHVPVPTLHVLDQTGSTSTASAQPNQTPASPKNPGKRLIQQIPLHVWEPSTPANAAATLPLEPMPPLAPATSSLPTKRAPEVKAGRRRRRAASPIPMGDPHVETKRRRLASPPRYPDDMREQIRVSLQERLRRHPAAS